MASSISATRAHWIAGGIWLALGSLLVIGNAFTAVLIALVPTPTGGAQQAIAWFYGLLLLAIVVVPFVVARRSRIDVDERGLHVVGVSGLAHAYRWSEIRGFDVAATRPGWLLWLSRWHAVEVELTSGETVLLVPSERHAEAAADQVRDRLIAAMPQASRPVSATVAAPPLPKVYRPSRLDRVLASVYLFVGVILVFGIAVGILTPSGTPGPTAGGAASGGSTGVPVGAYIGVIVWIVLIALYLRSRRERLVASDSGLELVPFLTGGRRIAWSEMQAFELETIHPYWAGIYGAAPWQVVTALLGDGSAIRLTPTERPGRSSGEVGHARDELEAILTAKGGSALRVSAAAPPGAAPGASASPPATSVATPRPVGGPSRIRAFVAVVVQLFLFGLLTLAAAGAVSSVATGAGSGSPLFVIAFGVSLLIPAMAAGAAALGVEAWFRRNQPKAVSFGRRPMTAPNAIRNLPARDYAPILATLELLVFVAIALLMLSLLPGVIAAQDTAGSIDVLVGIALFGGLGVIWARALRLMLTYREAG
ncbi:MAG TPA: hypothetical protein VKR30_02645 [Candidatus Limnocylindrales bacterium]|nr:hypothetical protein [Candidatus Limnocylindrales bacterium]